MHLTQPQTQGRSPLALSTFFPVNSGHLRPLPRLQLSLLSTGSPQGSSPLTSAWKHLPGRELKLQPALCLLCFLGGAVLCVHSHSVRKCLPTLLCDGLSCGAPAPYSSVWPLAPPSCSEAERSVSLSRLFPGLPSLEHGYRDMSQERTVALVSRRSQGPV